MLRTGTLLAVLLVSVQAGAAEPSAATVSADVHGLQSAKGKVGCWLFDSAHAKDYPTEPERARSLQWGKIAGESATVVFTAVPPGTYALACFHDENGNGKLDTNWLGIPNEGMVASNHAKGRMGPPKFEDAKFSVGSEPVAMRLKVKY